MHYIHFTNPPYQPQIECAMFICLLLYWLYKKCTVSVTLSQNVCFVWEVFDKAHVTNGYSQWLIHKTVIHPVIEMSVARNWHPVFSHHHSVLQDIKEHWTQDFSYSSSPSDTTMLAPSNCFCSIKSLLWQSLAVHLILVSSASIYYIWLQVSSLENILVTKRNGVWSDS